MRETFEELTKKLSPTLRRIAHKLNGHFTFFDDDDLYQEALTQLWLASEAGKLDDKTDSYILQGCYFHLKNYIRTSMDRAKIVSLNKLFDENDQELEDVIAVTDDRANDEMAENEMMHLLKGKGLTGREKKIVKLSITGLTVREIGSCLGISHVMVLKIKKRLKSKCLNLKKEISYQN